MISEAKPFGVICQDHGLLFITEEQFAADNPDCPECGKRGEFDNQLYKAAMVDGCDLCKKSPLTLNRSFVYDNEKGLAYCHLACYNCGRRKCKVKGCAARAKLLMYLLIGGTEEYLIPAAFCVTHGGRITDAIDDNLWQYIVKMKNANDQPLPNREDCRITMKEY